MPLTTIDSAAKRGALAVQEYAQLSGHALGNLFRKPFYGADLAQQADLIGVGSLPIVILTGFFLGGALAMQSASTLTQFGATAFTGQLVSFSMIKEIGPVVTALMVSGRNASGMASELGSMIVTEQIDAMRALGTDPIQKLVTPRMIATAIMLPCLTIIDDFVGMIGGNLMAYLLFAVPGRLYWSTVWRALVWNDVAQGLAKPFIYSFAVSLIGCYYGLRASGGTQGVGRATTQAMVSASVIVFVLNLFIGRIFIWISQLGQ